MREPKLSSVPEIARTTNNEITQIRKYTLITPLFGGGVEPGVADPVSVVRGTEVRGHLRFWWRATRGGAFGGDLTKMYAAEAEIWGSAAGAGNAGPSKVSFQVMVQNRGTHFHPVDKAGQPLKDKRGQPLDDVGDPNSLDGYAAFPLRATGKHLLQDVAFDLQIRFPAAYHTDVEAALWAWETFGGIGARTRRGFGALHCTHLSVESQLQTVPPPHAEKVHAQIQARLQTYIAEGATWPAGVPHLSRTTRTNLADMAPDADPMSSWRYLISELQAFRQMRSPNKYGKSDWPEPQSIRRITRNQGGVKSFPRAHFGLPIIFEFMHKGEPPKTTLQGAQVGGANHDRLASPLILRPLACAGGKGLALAAILDGTGMPPGGVVLKDAPGDPTVQTDVSPREAKNSKPLQGETDVLQAFLNFMH